jgi:hypothetical protein
VGIGDDDIVSIKRDCGSILITVSFRLATIGAEFVSQFQNGNMFKMEGKVMNGEVCVRRSLFLTILPSTLMTSLTNTGRCDHCSAVGR